MPDNGPTVAQMNEPATHERGRPDMAAGALCLIVAAFLIGLSCFKLSSLDTGYHLAYGRHFLATGRIVDRDPFLYPENARPFVNANWGSQVVMAAIERVAGTAGLIFLRWVLLAIIVMAIAVAAKQSTGNLKWAAWAAWAAALGAYERITLRPELFSYALLAVLVAILLRGTRSWRGVFCIGLIQLAWVNLHSYFLLGPMLAVAALAGAAFNRLRPARRHKDAPRQAPLPAERSAVLRFTAIALAVQLATCLLNPFHIHGALFPLNTLQMMRHEHVMAGSPMPAETHAWSVISEFHSPFSHLGLRTNARTLHAYLALLAIAAFAAIAALVRGRIALFAMLAIMIAVSTQMRRNIAPFAIAAAPIMAAALATRRRPDARPRRLTRAASGGLSLAVVASSIWWTVGMATGRFYYVEERIDREPGMGYSDRFFPRDATNWLAAQTELVPRLFVDYFISSNTLPWLPDRFKLFVDTNTFAYDESVLAAAQDVCLGRRDYRELFTQYKINIVLLSAQPNSESLISGLSRDLDWALVYFDRHNVIFIRRMDAHVPVIARNRLRPDDLDARAWLARIGGPADYRAMELQTSAAVPMSLGWYVQAETLLDEAARIAPDWARTWNNLGKCRAERAKSAAKNGEMIDAIIAQERAIACFERSSRLEPSDPVAAANLDTARRALAILMQR